MYDGNHILSITGRVEFTIMLKISTDVENEPDEITQRMVLRLLDMSSLFIATRGNRHWYKGSKQCSRRSVVVSRFVTVHA